MVASSSWHGREALEAPCHEVSCIEGLISTLFCRLCRATQDGALKDGTDSTQLDWVHMGSAWMSWLMGSDTQAMGLHKQSIQGQHVGYFRGKAGLLCAVALALQPEGLGGKRRAAHSGWDGNQHTLVQPIPFSQILGRQTSLHWQPELQAQEQASFRSGLLL